MLTETPRRPPVIDAQAVDEQQRHACTSHPTEHLAPCERTRTVRCDDAHRELYRNQFPDERSLR